MQSIISILIVLSLVFACKSKPTSQLDIVGVANAINKSRVKRGIISTDEAMFLVNAADARLMDIEEVKNANKISSQDEIKNYRSLMVNDQTMLLIELKGISNNSTISF